MLLHKRKVYLTYGIVLYLVTLIDLYTRRLGLSAAAELLVFLFVTETERGEIINKDKSRKGYLAFRKLGR